jgi:hypothetical protein
MHITTRHTRLKPALPNLAQVSFFGSDIPEFLNRAPQLCGVFGCRKTLWHWAKACVTSPKLESERSAPVEVVMP